VTVSKRARLIAPFAVLAVLAGLVAASQELAAAFHYPREFGGGLLDLGRVRIYPPWAILGWYGRYAGLYPKAFDQASLWGLLAAFLPIMVAIGVTRRIRRDPPAFGAEAWAQLGDVERAKLVDPKGKIMGRVLGRFAGRYLTYSGVEHAIIVGASRSGKGAGHVVPTLAA